MFEVFYIVVECYEEVVDFVFFVVVYLYVEVKGGVVVVGCDECGFFNLYVFVFDGDIVE